MAEAAIRMTSVASVRPPTLNLIVPEEDSVPMLS
jgi:hypothetical protein